MCITLAQPDIRLRYERSPGLLRAEVEALKKEGAQPPLVVLDEVQKVPSLLDEVQDLIDRRRARFILTGSSARKLRRGSAANLLPGRVTMFHLDPLSLAEQSPARLEDALLDGSLPGLAAGVGVAHTTIAAYYQILEDCLVTERIEPLTASATRRKAHPLRQVPDVRHGRAARQARVRFWRDPDGPEVDWVIDSDGRYTPIEVKWTETPDPSDARHLKRFLAEYPTAERAYLVCRAARKMKLGERILAIPWQELASLQEVTATTP